jgi:hypothetical protein
LTIKEKTLGFVVAHELHVNHYRVEGEDMAVRLSSSPQRYQSN